MRYRVELYPSNEGFAVSCPRLPGCWSQGTTEEEALDNIRVAIQEYLAAQLNAEGLDHLFVEVFVDNRPAVLGEALARTRRVLASLPARDAELLRAVFVDSADKKEVARRFEIDPDYVTILVERTKEKFRRMYAEDEAALTTDTSASTDHGPSEIREIEVPL